MPEGDNQTDYSGVNYDSVVGNCLSQETRDSIPSSWGEKYKGKDMNLFFSNAIADQKEISQRVRIPNDQTSDEDRRKFHTACGCPETPDGYEFDLPTDHDKEFTDWARGMFHKAGVSKTKAATLVKEFAAFSGGHATKITEAKATETKRVKDEAFNTADTALRGKWKGEDVYDNNLIVARAGYEKIFGEAARQKLADAGLNNNPEIIEAVFNHVSTLGEDKLIGGEGSPKAETKEQMLDRMYPDDAKKPA